MLQAHPPQRVRVRGECIQFGLIGVIFDGDIRDRLNRRIQFVFVKMVLGEMMVELAQTLDSLVNSLLVFSVYLTGQLGSLQVLHRLFDHLVSVPVGFVGLGTCQRSST